MIKNVFISALLVFSLFLANFSVSYAQQGVQDGTYTQSPGTGQTTTTDGTTEDRGFDWRWLLPLLAVPLLFVFMKGNKEEDRSEYRTQSYAGAKGGQARRIQDEEEQLI